MDELMDKVSAQERNARGWYPTPELQVFRTKGWIRSWDQHVLKQKWHSEFGYEDIWLIFPVVDND